MTAWLQSNSLRNVRLLGSSLIALRILWLLSSSLMACEMYASLQSNRFAKCMTASLQSNWFANYITAWLQSNNAAKCVTFWLHSNRVACCMTVGCTASHFELHVGLTVLRIVCLFGSALKGLRNVPFSCCILTVWACYHRYACPHLVLKRIWRERYVLQSALVLATSHAHGTRDR